MSEENVETLRTFYEAINRRDLDNAMQYIDPDAEVRTALEPVEQVGGQRGPIRGRDGVREFFEGLAETWEVLRVDFKEIIVGADGRIIAVENWRVRGRQGIEIDTELTDVYEFRGGLMVRAEGFREKSEALEAAGLSE